jgi:hypothetical protein
MTHKVLPVHLTLLYPVLLHLDLLHFGLVDPKPVQVQDAGSKCSCAGSMCSGAQSKCSGTGSKCSGAKSGERGLKASGTK